jgi:hypothetical protein
LPKPLEQGRLKPVACNEKSPSREAAGCFRPTFCY